MNIVDEAKLHSSICSTFEMLLVLCVVRCCHGENRALSVLGPTKVVSFLLSSTPADIALCNASHQFAEHTFRWIGFTRIQKAVVGQTGSRPPSGDRDWSFGASLALGSASEFLGPATELVTTGCSIKSNFCPTSQSDLEMVCFCVD